MRIKAPKVAILALAAAITMFVACGSDDDNDEDDTSTGDTTGGDTTGGDTSGDETISFSAVNTIMEDKCGGTTCHDSAGSQTTYVGNQTAFDGSATMETRISNDTMPPAGSTALTAAEKQTILDYIEQQSN